MNNNEQMTHYLSICNGLALLIRYNEDEDMIEYKYSDETTVHSTPIVYTNDDDEIGFFADEDFYYISEFCRINI